MFFNQTQINFCFPTFNLQVIHDDSHVLGATFAKMDENQEHQITGYQNSLTDEIIAQLDSYCKDPTFQFNLPYKFSGSLHQLKIWQLMRQIPCGLTISYGDAAYLVKSAPRAVGGACGKNPLPIFIPCHRIIAASHKLGGFNSGNIFFGLGIKKWLLEHEGVFINK